MIDRGLNALDSDNAGRRIYRFILVEQNPPFGVSVSEISEAVMSVGRRKVQIAVEKWTECLKNKRWPGYPPIVHRPDFPPYALASWQEREREYING